MPQYDEITLAAIEEGRFRRDVDDALATCAQALLKNLRVYDDDGASAKATFSVTLKRLKSGGEDAFSLKTSVKLALPGRPDSLTLAVQDGDQLVVRRSGSTEDSPRQAVLATQDGRAVLADGAAQANTNGAPRRKEL